MKMESEYRETKINQFIPLLQNANTQNDGESPSRKAPENSSWLVENLQEQEMNINSLPREMLMTVFSYLDHDARLEARLVCRFWKDSVLEPFNKVALVLQANQKMGTGEASFALLGTTSPWQHIVLINFNVSDYLMNWTLPQYLTHCLRTLTLHGGKFSWSWILNIIEQMECLEKLILRKPKGRIEVDVWNSWASTPYSDPNSGIHDIGLSQMYVGSGRCQIEYYYGDGNGCETTSTGFNQQLYK